MKMKRNHIELSTTHYVGLVIAMAVCLVVFGTGSVSAQTLVTNGATIHIRENAQVVVNGNTEIRTGDVRVYNQARVEFRGDVNVVRGGLYMLQDSYARVVRNLVVANDGIVWRYAPGSLDVEGSIFNRGELTNDGEINIGKP
ncbi:MAG: hypothetical protein J0I17_02030 ['Candidatus Kapabacteria' thiocyanatum]|uniref:Uncharacterized protein n=1 Tax=Candidatus Kapaibacterium thiocyanatum TaxID=1895771 RepID=A0A1M3KXH1_9BACT|nr:hypothetical protein ['Candidatus Kapabacteria' thiocyanatum]OJX56954.1 MAG: hypothetical protein BGO89_10560 ['Candidatus Kapabacteria' thiocyanatum]